ncbi:hypothetical protein MLD38_037234 [Melastoma candidum]|uniref:Uncharacterized protein n=1 Tax=Melastoma candidum TaxID=119954 RepID=A0ACB9LP12_9MYRT|nr:hypothetical protein MLD38_037234 [Melastoma candidum]
MGCVASSMEKDERMLMCKERKKLVKELLVYRWEFADALLAYLRALKNTGATLRQLTESESLNLDNSQYGSGLPTSPPLPLPPSPPPPPPPPPPPFSPDARRSEEGEKGSEHEKEKEIDKEENIEFNDHSEGSPPPPPVPNSWRFWDPFEVASPSQVKEGEVEDVIDEENWAETKTEFEEEGRGDEIKEKSNIEPKPKMVDDIEMVGNALRPLIWNRKGNSDMAMVVWRGKKSLEGIVKDLDEYFLKASAVPKDVAVLLDVDLADKFLLQTSADNNRKRNNSAKVVSALSWRWSSRSLQLLKDTKESSGPRDPCCPGAHRVTLGKIYSSEQKLYKEMREAENSKLEYERKSVLLQKQEEENYDWNKTEKTRLAVESLHSHVEFLQRSISVTCSTILSIVDEELYPQMVSLTSGLMQMWRMMYECHEVQNDISLQLSHISDDQIPNLSSEYHRQAAIQLVAEVESWYNSFCMLTKYQKETLCKGWLDHLEKLPDKVASESIRNFLLAMQSILLKHAEEQSMEKKTDKLERRLQKELFILDEMECKFEVSHSTDGVSSELIPGHPLLQKRAKVTELKKRVDDENAKYLNSVKQTKAKCLNHLKTGLPNVFQALTDFSSSSAQAFEAIHNHATTTDRQAM